MTTHEMVTRADGTKRDHTAPTFGDTLTTLAAQFPPLHEVAAHSVAQERWERLVSEVTLPFPASAVWEALVDPSRVRQWLAVCRGSWARPGEESMLDFEDGEFFYCWVNAADPPGDERAGRLHYLWRWVGIGPVTSVTWNVTPSAPCTTTVTVTEESTNPPSDWRSWNGMGWPGILEQLASHLRTATSWRWPWRRMGPYVQGEIGAPPFEAWATLTSVAALQHWLSRTAGSLAVGDPMRVTMGDASGSVVLEAHKVVEAGQEFPAFLPYVEFALRRPSWDDALGGRLWIEPAGLGRSLLQVFHHNWEGVRISNPLEERRILTEFWISAFRRGQALFRSTKNQRGPHGWSA